MRREQIPEIRTYLLPLQLNELETQELHFEASSNCFKAAKL